MHKNIKKITIILATIIILFLCGQYTTIVYSASDSEIDWEAPNKSGKQYDKYKFKMSDVVNSDLAMQVVGCTGVVDMASNWMSTLGGILEKEAKEKAQDLLEKSVTEICSGLKAGGVAAVSASQKNLTDAVKEAIDCGNIQNVKDKEAVRAEIKRAKQEVITKRTEQCFAGIAVNLAKNQLTAMTRSAISWINTGFEGDPFYVQNITNFTNRLERNVIETGVNVFTDKNLAFPYGNDFSKSIIYSWNSGTNFKTVKNDLFSDLQSDLINFVLDPLSDSDTYYGSYTAKQKSLIANDKFADDFSVGGWKGYIALTQRDQNNPLGFTMLASERIAEQQEQQKEETNNELKTNGGFLSQKKCILWRDYDEAGPVEIDEWDPTTDTYEWKYNDREKKDSDGFDQCVDWKVTTPGSLIKEKMAYYVNSPERQLELADGINDSLNAVFNLLISKLQLDGLSGINTDTSSNAYSSSDNIDSNFIYESADGGYETNSYSSSIDLTKDLGNTYMHDVTYKLGTWNAKTNTVDTTTGDYNSKIIPLYPDLAPKAYMKDGSEIASNMYYVVTVPGNTHIIENGYNGWSIGDRAFWDGTSWQNWRCQEKNGKCTLQMNPIKKRGIIQIQKDFIVAGSELLRTVSKVMPKLGELDYCIPGPNPNYKSNSQDIQNAYTNWINSFNNTYQQNGLFERDSTVFDIADPGDADYENWHQLYTDHNVWDFITSDRTYNENSWGFGLFTYPFSFLDGEIKQDRTEAARYNDIRVFTSYVQNMFNNFYETFDKMMNNIYFDDMTKAKIANEKTSILVDNPHYIKMAEEGLAMTQNMVETSDEISNVKTDYQDDINQANINVAKLEAIKEEVGKIITKAQNRRAEEYLEIVKKDKCNAEYNKCMSSQGIEGGATKQTISLIPVAHAATISGTCQEKFDKCMETPITEADKLAYKTKYKDCLEEENIDYLDDFEMTAGTGDDTERCSDLIDNDLDGLTDEKDPDCRGTSQITGGGGSVATTSCQDISSYTTRDEGSLVGVGTYSCSHYSTAQTCNGASYAHESYDQGGEKSFEIFQCGWVGGTQD